MAISLCVLIPAKNEEVVIARTLRSILFADVAAKDIYLIDDGSSDATGDIARSFGVNVLRNEKNKGKALSVARATEHFGLIKRYGVIAMMDADTLVHPDYYLYVRRGFEDPKV